VKVIINFLHLTTGREFSSDEQDFSEVEFCNMSSAFDGSKRLSHFTMPINGCDTVFNGDILKDCVVTFKDAEMENKNVGHICRHSRTCSLLFSGK